MEAQVRNTAARIFAQFQTLDKSQRLLIGVAGIPGSGKTTFAASLTHHINHLYRTQRHETVSRVGDCTGKSGSKSQPDVSQINKHSLDYHEHVSNQSVPDIAFALPLDGYHLTRKQLSMMANPEEAHYRRGAPFTFDSQSYLELLLRLHQPIEATTRTIWAPSFDHAKKDPVENDIPIPSSARIVVIEGLYTGLTYSKPDNAIDMAWTEASKLLNGLIFINVSIPVATIRVAKRNFAAGLSPSYEAAIKRTEENDMRNAQEILHHLPPAERTTLRIESVEDEEWKGFDPNEDMLTNQSHTVRNVEEADEEKGQQSCDC